MHEDYPGEKLCIFISKNDKYEGIVLYELLLEIAFNSRLSGGTVTIGDKGFFGAQDESTRLKILRSSENLPVVLEFQGMTNRIDRYIERIQPMIKDGLFTRTDVRITKFNSTDEDTTDFQDQENEDQSQIFDEDVEGADIPDSHPPGQEFKVDKDKKSESEFLELDQDQTTEEDEVDTAEPHIEIPSFEDDDDNSSPAFESLDTDPESIREDEVKEVPDPPVAGDSFVGAEGDEDEPDTSMDDNHIQENAVNDAPDAERDSFIDEGPDEGPNEDDPVYQLTDMSETQAEESSADKFEMDDSHGTVEDKSNGTESAEPKTEEDIDKLFDERNEKFESTFDDMLKEVGGASMVDTDIDSVGKTTSDKEPVDSSGDEQGESASKDQKIQDKDNKEEDMKNYFSELFKK